MSVDTAAGKLRRALSHMEEDPPPSIIEQEEVLSEFSPIFQPDEIDDLSEDQFLRFLPYRNNRHWTGLARQGPKMTQDMVRLREGLRVLLDEDRELTPRVTEAKDMVDGMGKGTLSAILLVAYPDKYGVWNNTSEAGLKQLDVWPDFERGEPFGSRYERVNTTLRNLRDEVGVDLWTLDTLLNQIVEMADEDLPGPEDESAGDAGEFVAERHLQEFLVRNWDNTQLSDDWAIYSDADDPEAGVEFPTGVGPADLLLRHRTEDRLCVVELKKSRSSDRAVGQLLRYVGWVREHRDQLDGVDPGTTVEGLLIVSEETDRLRYALSAVPDVDLRLYQVNFELLEAD